MKTPPVIDLPKLLAGQPDLTRDLLHPSKDTDAVMKEFIKRRKAQLCRTLVHFSRSRIKYWFTTKNPLSPASFAKIPDGQLIAPGKADLDELEKLVSELATLLRKTRPRSVLESFRAVDRIDPRLKLKREILTALDRAKRTVPPRPLDIIARLKAEPGKIGKLAVKYLVVTLAIRKGDRDPKTVDWRGFTGLLLRYRNEQRQRCREPALALLAPRVPGGMEGSTLNAYTVYLELEQEDRLWCSKVGTSFWPFKYWVERGLGDIAMLRKLEQFSLPAISAAEEEDRVDAERRAQHRAGPKRHKNSER